MNIGLRPLVEQRSARVILFCLILANCFAGLAQATPTYSITVLPSLGSHTFANAINNSGQAVGGAMTAAGKINSFIYSAGSFVDLGTFGGTFSILFDINDSGQAVGGLTSANGSTSTFQAFLYSSGVFTSLGHTAPTGINSSGQIVGYTNPPLSGFLYNQGVFTNFGTFFVPTGINDSGQIVGGRAAGSCSAAALYQNGLLTPIGTLGGSCSNASGINAHGNVVGGSTLSNGTYHPFFYSNGTMLDLLANTAASNQEGGTTALNKFDQAVGSYSYGLTNSQLLYWDPMSGAKRLNLGEEWTNVSANDINDAGQIVGEGMWGGVYRAFILTPDSDGTITADPITVPEASCLVLLAIGLPGLIAVKSRKAAS